MSLRLRLILAFLVLSVVPLGAMTWYSYVGSARALREAAAHESDLLAGELTQRMQFMTAELGDRMERLADVDVEAPIGQASAMVANAPPPTDPTSALEATVAQRLGDAAMLLNNVELRGIPPPRGRTGDLSGRGARGSSSRSSVATAAADASAIPPPPEGRPGRPSRGRGPGVRPPSPGLDRSAAAGDVAPPPSAPSRGDAPGPAAADLTPASVDPARGPAADAARPTATDPATARVEIDLAQLRRRLFRELAPDRPFDQLTPEERQRLIAEVNQRLLGVKQGLELGAAELQKQADEAKRRAQAPGANAASPAESAALTAPPPASPATTAIAAKPITPTSRAAIRKKRTLTGDRLDIQLERGGHINAQVNIPDVLATIFSTTQRARGEVPFAVGKDGRVYAASSIDRGRVQALGASVTSRDAKTGTTRLPEWIVVTTDDPTGSGLRFGIARPVGDALKDLRSTAARTAGLGLLFIAVTLVGIVPLSTGLTRNVTRLSDGVRKIAGGDYSARVAVKTNDEMGELARAFNQMAEDVERHQHIALQQERIKRELELGREIQDQMLPRAPLTVGLTEIDGISVPAGEVGGDFYNYFTLADGRVALLIGDVSGKGVGAALLMANIQASIRTRLTLGQDLVKLVDELDRDIYANTPGPVYATLLVGLLDPASGVLRYVNAGHHLPYVVRHSGAVNRLETSGLPIGMLAGRGYTEGQLRFSPGDLLFCYTDGCVEVENERGEPFGAEALERELTAASPAPSGAVLAQMNEVLRTFRGSREPFDDATMLAVTVG